MTSGNSLSTAGLTKLAAMLIVGVIVIAAVLAPMLNDLTRETIVENYNDPDDASWIRMNYGTENIDTEYSVAGDTLTIGDQSGAAQDMILYADEKVCVMYSDGFTIVNGYSDPATVTKADTVHITNADGTLTISDGTDIIIQTSSPAWAYYPDTEGTYSYFSADVEGVKVKDGDNPAYLGTFAGAYAYNNMVVVKDEGTINALSLNAVIEDGIITSVTWAIPEVIDTLSTTAIDFDPSTITLQPLDPSIINNPITSGGVGLMSADPTIGTQVGDLYYKFQSGDVAQVVGYSSSIDWTSFHEIPETITYNDVTYTVTSIASSAFKNCTSITNLTIPDTVTWITSSAFEGCTNLTVTSLPAGLTAIGPSAFRGCTSLALTSLPAGVTSIGVYAFTNCTNLALTSLPAGITSINSQAFAGCSNVTFSVLPAELTLIESLAFSGCNKMDNLIIQSSPTISSSVFPDTIKEVLNLGSMEITTTSYGLNADEVRSDIPAMGYVAPLSNTKVVEKEGTAYDILLMMPVLLVIALLIPIADYFVGDNIRSRIR